MVAGESKFKIPAPLLSHRNIISKYIPNLLPVPEELGKSAAWMARHNKQV